MRAILYLMFAFLCFAMVPTMTAQQYFGRNKPNYTRFDFQVHQSNNFEIYHYLENREYLQQFADWAEQWYAMHQRILQDTIVQKNPLILYNNHADFQQTNTIFGSISVGTGGVTEAFKNRVIMPIAMSNQQTFHVLGHELVHAFQYNMVINGDSTNLNNIANLPLWLVEGLAEYMSIGGIDANTAMWMRDAVLHNDVPSIENLNNPRYFPYRYGHAFWVFLTGMYGDEVVRPFYIATAKYGFDNACVVVLGMTRQDLSRLWEGTIKSHFGKFVEVIPDSKTESTNRAANRVKGQKDRTYGTRLISQDNAGRMNISPVVSPNGRYVIFLSEKDIFGIDLFLADANTGDIIRKIASTAKDGHLDDFDFIESAGTWSPRSDQFAFVAFKKGKQVLVIKNAETGKTVEEISMKGVPAFTNPAWSPDGRKIAFTGLVQGQVDLYTYDLRTERVEQLTNDPYSEMHPHWSPDGTLIIFATDELSYEKGRKNGKFTFNLAELDMASLQSKHIDVFPGADNLNPMYDSEGNILFLSDRDGFRNIYKYDVATKKVFRRTDLFTGVSGITPYAPAMSIERRRDRVFFMHYLKNSYSIYRARPEDFIFEEEDPNVVDFTAATLPRVNPALRSVVDAQLSEADRIASEMLQTFLTPKPYRPKFKLDYLGGNTGVGIGNNAFGTTTGLLGGVDLLFSDILGNNQFFSTIAMNGEVTDIGGQLTYLNRKRRLNWGATLSHVPFRQVAGGYLGIDTIPGSGGFIADRFIFQFNRIFEQRVGLFTQYPFSQILRVEGGASAFRYSNRIDVFNNYYDGFGRLVFQERERQGAAPPFALFTAQAALVGDNSFFGLTAPLRGHRFRLGADQYWGEFNFTSATADFRVYRFLKPIGLAFRVMHYGRYGEGGNRLFPFYVGSPWFMRGFNSNVTEELLVANGQSFDQLLGSKMAVGNFEIRIPFTGPKQLALIKSNFLFSDLNFFVDAGAAWFDFEQFNPSADSGLPEVKPVFSAGASLRINVFGAMVVEPYYAYPLLKNSRFVFGLNILPGW